MAPSRFPGVRKSPCPPLPTYKKTVPETGNGLSYSLFRLMQMPYSTDYRLYQRISLASRCRSKLPLSVYTVVSWGS